MTADPIHDLTDSLKAIPGADRVPPALATLDEIALRALRRWYAGTEAGRPPSDPPTAAPPRHDAATRLPERDRPGGTASYDEAGIRSSARGAAAGDGPRQGVGWPHGGHTPAGVAPRHAGLARRWVEAVTSRPWVAPVVADPEAGGERIDRAYADLGFPARMARFHRDTLAVLPGLIRDEVSVQRLLFGEGDVLGGLAAYQDNLVTRALNAACGRVVARLARSRTAPLRILELGGGAGLSTDAVLAALDGRAVNYRFSDVSPLFTRAASARHPGLTCDLIDIDHDLEPQGVAAGCANVVLAGNVLHNAADLGRTLGRIHRALAPGGTLLFTEATSEPPAVLTSMSLLLSPAPGRAGPGAYDGRAAEGRIFPDRDAWIRVLTTAGLAPGPVAPEPGTPLAAAGQYVFVATRRP